MVFTGKPSTGCGTCKKRRVKCDEQRPKCGQCIKSKRECAGYANRLDLLFRDETVATVNRANNALSRGTGKKQSGWTSDLTFNTVSSSSTSNSTPNIPTEPRRKARITHSPTIGVREQASNHFLSNYVLVPPGSIGFSYYGYIVPLINTSTRPHFLAAYEACSLASLANCLGSGVELEKQALGKYTKALSLVSSAISDPVLSLENDTIVAIQLLGLYENIAGKHFGSLAWGSHIEGVIHLCRQRGPEMMQTEAGRELLRHVKTQCMIYLYTNMKGFSKGVEVWLQDLEVDAITSRFHSIGLQVGLLRHDMIRLFETSPKDPQNIERMIAMIDKCKTLDRMCVEWTRNLPESYRHKTMQWDFAVINNDYSNVEAFPGKINIFPGTWSSALWCILQGTRIVTCSLILRGTAWQHMSPSYLEDPGYTLYFEALREVVNEMAASVPYMMGWLANHPEQQTTPNLDTYVCGMDNVIKGLGSYNSIWSLSCVLCSDTTSDEQRAWAKGRLRYISDVLGIRSARGTLALTNKFPSGFIRYDAMVMQKLGVHKSTS